MIKIGSNEIKLTLDVQISKKNRPFRMSGLTQSKKGRYINRVEKFKWKYNFIFLDQMGGYFEVIIDENDTPLKYTEMDKYLRIIKNIDL